MYLGRTMSSSNSQQARGGSIKPRLKLLGTWCLLWNVFKVCIIVMLGQHHPVYHANVETVYTAASLNPTYTYGRQGSPAPVSCASFFVHDTHLCLWRPVDAWHRWWSYQSSLERQWVHFHYYPVRVVVCSALCRQRNLRVPVKRTLECNIHILTEATRRLC